MNVTFHYWAWIDCYPGLTVTVYLSGLGRCTSTHLYGSRPQTREHIDLRFLRDSVMMVFSAQFVEGGVQALLFSLYLVSTPPTRVTSAPPPPPQQDYTVKKVSDFPVPNPAGMSLTFFTVFRDTATCTQIHCHSPLLFGL
jgi:hypothetical protein